MRDTEKSLAYGGQAVLEGIMMRSNTHMVISIRKKNGEILTTSKEIPAISRKSCLLRLPFIRGIPALFETLYLGFKSLFYSANIVIEEEKVKFSHKEVFLTFVLILGFSSFFIVSPLLLTNFFSITGLIFNIVEALLRITFFLVFLMSVSLWKEYRRVLQYHGAEHKAINAYEAGATLNLIEVKRHSRLHPRCGTSFLVVLMSLSILLFSIIPNQTFLERLAYRLVLIPIISAISYEILRFSGKHRNSKIIRAIVIPGLGLQHLTTKEPDDDMIMVALEALTEVDKQTQKQRINVS